MSTAELLTQFVAEARECLEGIGTGLLAVERTPDDVALLNDLFRSVHTLKGNCGLFDFKALERVVHAGEDLLERVRSRTLDYSPALADALLDATDYCSELIDQIEQRGAVNTLADAASHTHSAALRALLEGGPWTAPTECSAVCAAEKPPAVAAWATEAAAGSTACVALRYQPEPDCFFKGEDPWRLASTTPGLLTLAVTPEQCWPQGSALDEWDCYRCNLLLLLTSEATPEQVRAHFQCVSEQVELIDLHGAADSGQQLTQSAAEVLEQRSGQLWDDQMQLLASPGITPGGVASCVRSLDALLCARPAVDAARARALRPSVHDATALLEWARAQARPALSPVPDAGPAVLSQMDVPAAEEVASERKVLRVSQARIDRMMDLVGEMVVAKNSLPYLAQRAEQHFGQRELSREIKAQYAVINRIAEDLQHALMEVRMLPVGTVFQRFGRLVRDLSRKLGKQVQLVVEGEDTEADKNIIESLADPLIHILRNCLDHGLEQPEVRRAAGKPEVGTIRITAQQEGGRVTIAISDDGAGIDPQRVLVKAVDRGLISSERAAALSAEEAVQLVFLPGFSTAAQISDLSGRGVGMDVVRNAVERIHGTVELQTRPGQGTTLTLSLPLSMAVSHVMVVESAGLRLGVPMDLIVETVRVHAEDIHRFKSAQTTVLRGRVVPLVALNDLLEMDAPALRNADDEHAVLVLRLPSGQVGLLVDHFHGVTDILLKPLEGVLAGLTCMAGTALMGDGSVLMVLNPKELV